MNLTFPALPDLPDLGDIELPELPNLDDIGREPPPNPLAEVEASEEGSNEEFSQRFDAAVDDEFAKIRQGREQQRQAVELANDSEYWFAVYFQTREQKDRFLQAMKWAQHGDKYLDGEWVAKKQGIELPPRPAPYKVGIIDGKLKALT